MLFVLGTIGASFILVDSTLFAPIRSKLEKYEYLYSMVTCYQCNSFWLGMLFGFFLISSNLFSVFACGCAASFLSIFAAAFINVFESFTSRMQSLGSPFPQNVPCVNCGKKQTEEASK